MTEGAATRGGTPPTWVAVLVLAIVYVASAVPGLTLAEYAGNVTAAWPPAGISLAALLVWGRRAWPGVLIGSFLTNLFVVPTGPVAGVALGGALVISSGSTLEILSAAWMLERWAHGRAAAATSAGVGRFVGVCAMSSAGAALVGLLTTATTAGLPMGHWFGYFMTWWVGDWLGMLTITPLVLRDGALPRRGRTWEYVAVAVAGLAYVQVVFGRPFPSPTGTSLPVAWLILPLALWAGARLGTRAVGGLSVVASAMMSWGTLVGRGPFAGLEPPLALVVNDLLLVTTCLTGLLFAGAAAETAVANLKLQEAARVLERKVAERTERLEAASRALLAEAESRTLLAARLVVAQKQEALGRLAGGVAHDFNNLLMVISGQAELIQAVPTPPDRVREAAHTILTASQRAADLTRQLLAVARRQPVVTRYVDLARFLTDARRLLRPLMPESVNLDIVVSPESSGVEIDPGELEQVVLNLSLNARDALPSGGRLRIEQGARTLDPEAAAELGVAPGDWVWVEFSDTGGGMTPDVIGRVFEPFFTTKDRGRGTGLGLSTAAGVIAQANGILTARNNDSGGASFTVWLPRRAPPAEAPSPQVAPRMTPDPESARILVVEDDPSVRALVASALAARGYHVTAAADGAEALALFEAHPVDLIVSDVVMPNLGGAAMARALRNTTPIRIIFMSGYVDTVGELSGETVLSKPFPMDVLYTAVTIALAGPAR